MKPFRFMATLPAPAHGGDWGTRLADLAEIGFDTVAMADHFTGGWDLEPLIALAIASQHTAALRFQTNVLSNDYRHPVLLHRMAATFDRLSGGRLELGVGAGWLESDYRAAGIPFDRPGVRIDRLAESLTVLKALFGAEPLTFAGRHYEIRDLLGVPEAMQQPHPPLFVGGGRRRILTLAGREGNIVGVHVNLGTGRLTSEVVTEMTHDRLREKLSWIQTGAEESGRTLDDLELHMNFRFCHISESEAGSRRFLDGVAKAWSVDRDLLAHSPNVLVGSPDACVEQLREAREMYGISYLHFDPYPLEKETWSNLPAVIAALRRADRSPSSGDGPGSATSRLEAPVESGS